jgi:hypothetical protein
VRSSGEPEGIGASDALAVLRMQHEILERAERLESRLGHPAAIAS